MTRFNCITTTEQLLSEILQTLERIEMKLDTPAKKVSNLTPPALQTNSQKICAYCGSTHPRAIDYATCARMAKRKESK
jgi:hypothetical protein